MIVYIPIRGPEITELKGEYERFLNDFSVYKETNDIKKILDDQGDYKTIRNIEFEILSKFKNDDKNEEIRNIESRYPLSFKTKILDYTDEFLKINLTLNTSQIEDDYLSINLTVDHIVVKLVLIINLTYATKVDFLRGIIISNNDKYIGKTEIILSTLDYAYEHSIKIKWPKLSGLNLSDTIKWYNKNNIHLDSISKNKLHRAINAFSYQFSKLLEKDTDILFWTMLGIETLLAEDANNITNQIKIKSSIILGEPKEYKKKLGKLYGYRSRFVHGDIDFPAKFGMDIDNFEEEYWDYLHFASSILIALIRNLIAEDKNEFKFEYKLIVEN